MVALLHQTVFLLFVGVSVCVLVFLPHCVMWHFLEILTFQQALCKCSASSTNHLTKTYLPLVNLFVY